MCFYNIKKWYRKNITHSYYKEPMPYKPRPYEDANNGLQDKRSQALVTARNMFTEEG